MKRSLICLLLFSLFAQGGFASNAPILDVAQQQNPNGLISPSLSPSDITPPEQCGVPLNGPFGRDLEVFRGGGSGLRYDYPPHWNGAGYIQSCTTGYYSPAISAAAVNSEQIVAVWKESRQYVRYKLWNGSWSGEPTTFLWELVDGDGNPVVISSDGHTFETYVRVEEQILQTTWDNNTTTPWAKIAGQDVDMDAAADPAVINAGPHHVLVFYRDINGNIRFTESQSGIWRDTPLFLPGTERKNIYLPLIARHTTPGSLAGQVDPAKSPTSRKLPAVTQASELSAASRNANHAAVFFVDEKNRLWVNEWTHLNKSDWSDTRWQLLMENVMIEKPAVASRHINHLAVAVRDATGMPYLIEWTQDLNNTGQPGWQAPYALGSPAGQISGPLTLAAASVDGLAVFGVDESGSIWQKNWMDGVWDGWIQLDGSLQNPAGKIVTAVVRRLNDIMLLFPATNQCFGFQHYTSQGDPPVEKSIVPTATGYPRGQTFAWTGGKTLWLTAHPQDGPSPQYWQVDAFEMVKDGQPLPQPAKLVLAGDHQYTADTLVDMAAGDLDFDGDEEVVVATTYKTNSAQISLSVLKYNPSTPILSTLTTQVINTTLNAPLSFSLALDDLDGDEENYGVKNELVLTYKKRNDSGDIKLIVYQYDIQAHALVQKGTTSLPLDLNGYMDSYFGAQIEVDTGRFYPGYPGQQIVVSNLDVYWYDGFYYKFPTLRTYSVDTSASDWSIDQVHDDSTKNDQITHKKWWELNRGDGDGSVPLDLVLGKYSSGLDTGDLDADGYDEIAIGYSNEVLSVDPGGVNAADIVKTVTFEPGIYSIGPDRSLAVGDMDRDGRAEILSEMYIKWNADLQPKFSLFEMMGNGALQKTSSFTLKSHNQGGRLNAILVGDTDHDSYVSTLTGCTEFDEVKIVAVLNGAPRWYANGLPINDSQGTYSFGSQNQNDVEFGTKINLGTSLSLGFEQQFDIPFIGISAGEVRGSVSWDFMSSHGVRMSNTTYNSCGKDLGFVMGLGEVVYELVSTQCFFYDVYDPDSPQNTSKAMVCIPDAQDAGTQAMSLDKWRSQDTKDAAGLSWADVGHRAPNGSYTNDLSIPGNYSSYLPVDDFMLLHQFTPVTVKDDPGIFMGYTYAFGGGGARTRFFEMESNMTSSIGATAFGVTVDASVTMGAGIESSETASWTDQLSFYGGIYHFQDSNRLCYTMVPYVYQAKAKTLAGVTYFYWEMDYYVTRIGGSCILGPVPSP